MGYILEDGKILVPDGNEKKEITNTSKKYVGKSKVKSKLDIIVDEIIENKKIKNYTIYDPEESEYDRIERESALRWENDEGLKKEFDGDYVAFVLANAINYSFDFEQEQKQLYYGVKKTVNTEGIVYAVSYDDFMSVAERITDGYFTVEEKETLATAMMPLAKSIYRKYIPMDDVKVGPYDSDDVWDAIYFGMTRALNTYVSLSDKMRASFSSWAYMCMNNACLDMIKSFNCIKRKKFIKVSLDDDEYAGFSNEGGGNYENALEKETAVNKDNEEALIIERKEDRRTFLNNVFSYMEQEGHPEKSKKRVLILKGYFGLLSDIEMTFEELSGMLNMKISEVKKEFDIAKKIFAEVSFELGYTTEDVLELLS